MSTDPAREPHTVLDMDPVRNPYAPGAGQRPPELAGRDRELRQFEVTLERVGAGRPDRSMVLSGLRGVGKTVLLNTLRGQAVSRAWGTGKIEPRPEQSVRIPVAQAVHAAVREVSHRHRDPDRVDAVGGVLKSFALRTGVEDRRALGGGTAGSGERRANTRSPGLAALCAACHEISQQGAPLIVVGAGLPHLPAVLSASKSYSERLFRYLRIDRLGP